jgi:hypothetical protein
LKTEGISVTSYKLATGEGTGGGFYQSGVWLQFAVRLTELIYVRAFEGVDLAWYYLF